MADEELMRRVERTSGSSATLVCLGSQRSCKEPLRTGIGGIKVSRHPSLSIAGASVIVGKITPSVLLTPFHHLPFHRIYFSVLCTVMSRGYAHVTEVKNSIFTLLHARTPVSRETQEKRCVRAGANAKEIFIFLR